MAPNTPYWNAMLFVQAEALEIAQSEARNANEDNSDGEARAKYKIPNMTKQFANPKFQYKKKSKFDSVNGQPQLHPQILSNRVEEEDDAVWSEDSPDNPPEDPEWNGPALDDYPGPGDLQGPPQVILQEPGKGQPVNRRKRGNTLNREYKRMADPKFLHSNKHILKATYMYVTMATWKPKDCSQAQSNLNIELFNNCWSNMIYHHHTLRPQTWP